MSNDIKLVGFRATIEESCEIRSYAEEHGMSVSDLLRKSIKQYLTNDKSVNADEFNIIKQQLGKKDEQIEYLHQQIEHLHQLLAMEKQNMATLTKQLGQKDLLLEDMREREVERKVGFFARLFGFNRWTRQSASSLSQF